MIDPITGESVRSSRRSPNRYEHPIAGAMVHIDVKKLGRIPAAVDGGCTAATPRSQLPTGTKTLIGYDYIHTAIDDYTRLAYSEVLPDEKDPTCAGFLHRAMTWFAAQGVRACTAS